MNYKSCRLLSYLLIVMLTITPLRSALAGSAPCMKHAMMENMAMSTMSMTQMSINHSNKMLVSSHHDMTRHNGMNHSMAMAQTKAHKCCCCKGAHHCTGHQCDMGSPLVYIPQTQQFSPVMVLASQAGNIDDHPLGKAFTPPFRPPLILS